MSNANEDLLIDMPTEKVYNQKQIIIGTFLGGILAAAYMLAANFKTFGQPTKAKTTWFFAFLFFAFIFISAFVPVLDSIPGYVFTVVSITAVALTYSQLQAKPVELHRKWRDGAQNSKGSGNCFNWLGHSNCNCIATIYFTRYDVNNLAFLVCNFGRMASPLHIIVTRTFTLNKLLSMNIKKYFSLVFLLVVLFSINLPAQKIIYSEPDRDDPRNLDFEIIGKLSGNYLIYKNVRDAHSISVYDAQMKLAEKNKLDFLPDKIINADFLTYPDFFYMFYQYQKRSIVYSMAVKLDNKGKKMMEPIQLDTTDINYFASNKIYSIINSEDKQRIMSYKVNSKDDKLHIVTTVLFDKNLSLLHKTRIGIQMLDRNDFLSEFQLDNDGDLIFVKPSGTAQNDNINKVVMFTKAANADEVSFIDLKLNNINLDDISVKVDNFNKRYLISSFYSAKRRGNVDGLYCFLWDKVQGKELLSASTTFSEELRNDAKGDNSIKGAFNDYFVRNIIMKKDGGFIVVSESEYTSTRGGINNSRWDYLNGSPYWGSNNYYNNSSYGYNYPWSRYNSFNNITRYYADNIAVVSYDATGKMEWSNIINKSQFDDSNDNFIGFTLANTGDQLHFIFNVQEKQTLLLSDQNISPEGQITRNPTIKNLDKGYDFMPRKSKQVGARQLIVPCQYRNYVCFAKVDL